MPLTLLLRIPDLPRFDAATPAGWTLLDNANAVLRSGEGPLAGLPRAERVIAIAPVSHLLFIETALPPVAPAKREALLRYAIEDKLTIDPSTVHAVVVGKADAGRVDGTADGGQHVVVAIDRGWFGGALQWLKAGGMRADAVIASAAGVTAVPGEWAVVFDQGRGFVKRADGFVHHLDIGSGREPPFGLTLALKEAREHQRAPSALVLHAPPSRDAQLAPDAALSQRWAGLLGLPVRLGAAVKEDVPSILAAARSANLLSGEFAPQKALGRSMRLFKPALIVLALMAIAHIVFTLVDNGRMNRERQAIEQEMTHVFRAAFPDAKAIVDPALQMQRNLRQLKRERGLASDADTRMQIARLVSLLQALPGDAVAVKSLAVRDGVATLEAELAGLDQRAVLQRAVDRVPGAALGHIDAGASASSRPMVRVTLRAAG